MSNEAMLELKGLNKAYTVGGREVRALEDLDLTINKGELVAIVGPSGSGKSTLLNLIGAIDSPTAGDVVLGGESITIKGGSNWGREAKLTRLRLTKIGFVFQSFYLIPTLTALGNVELPMTEGPARLPKPDRRARAQDLLSQVGLAKREKHYPSQLSGGEQQRVAIARALANNPELILADEPTGELDTETSKEIVELFHELNRTDHRTILVVTHDLEVAESMHRIIKLRDGKVVEDRRTASAPEEE